MILGWRRARFTAGQPSRRLGPHLALYVPVGFFLRHPSLVALALLLPYPAFLLFGNDRVRNNADTRGPCVFGSNDVQRLHVETSYKRSRVPQFFAKCVVASRSGTHWTVRGRPVARRPTTTTPPSQRIPRPKRLSRKQLIFSNRSSTGLLQIILN